MFHNLDISFVFTSLPPSSSNHDMTRCHDFQSRSDKISRPVKCENLYLFICAYVEILLLTVVYAVWKILLQMMSFSSRSSLSLYSRCFTQPDHLFDAYNNTLWTFMLQDIILTSVIPFIVLMIKVSINVVTCPSKSHNIVIVLWFF